MCRKFEIIIANVSPFPLETREVMQMNCDDPR